MKELRDFCRDIFAHVANEGKKSKKAVELSYHSWAARMDETENTEFIISQHYRVSVDQPRNDALQAYNDYLLAKDQLWESWRTARHEQKTAILREIFRMEAPNTQTYNKDVYTKNVHVL